MAITYRPVLVDELISSGRLHSYGNVFNHSSDAELVGAYLWNQHVCGALYPLLQLTEISLRNAVDHALSPPPHQMWWARRHLRYASFRVGGREPDVVRKLSENFAKAASSARRDRIQRYGSSGHPTHHQIIAKTDFSTWEFVFDSEFQGPSLFWPEKLSSVFRGSWSHRPPTIMLAHARDQVRSIRELRNRVFHHEPVWKRAGIDKEQQALTHLMERIDQINDFLAIIHPSLSDLVKSSSLLNSARRACSIGELRRLQKLAKTHKVKTKQKLFSLVAQGSERNEVLTAKIYLSGGCRFLIVPYR